MIASLPRIEDPGAYIHVHVPYYIYPRVRFSFYTLCLSRPSQDQAPVFGKAIVSQSSVFRMGAKFTKCVSGFAYIGSGDPLTVPAGMMSRGSACAVLSKSGF